MKTDTRSCIVKIIEKNGKARPFDLVKALGISAQAIHRHLKSLVSEGVLEIQGAAPYTQYTMAGIPDLERASQWMNARTLTESPGTFVSETRDVLAARLPHLKSFVKKGLSEKLLPLVISTSGEIGNNSFDHNLGQWRDVPGCWFESQVTGGCLWICIGDRGQGVFQSLARVHPELKDEQTALEAAFEKIISGRAPEKRGNGLKFVRSSLSKKPESGLACISGDGRVHYGAQGEKCLSLLDKHFSKVKGTVTLIVWRLQ